MPRPDRIAQSREVVETPAAGAFTSRCGLALAPADRALAPRYDYITREGEYDESGSRPRHLHESENMPGWAQDDPRDFWDAADLYERANGRLYISADFALPRGLDEENRSHSSARSRGELTSEERLPYTVAIHSGRDADGNEHNPHAHLMISERKNDGIERSREQFFRARISKHPERGGAPKSRTFHGREWLEHARERWATCRTKRSSAPAGRNGSITAATNARGSIASQASTTGPGLPTWSPGGVTTMASRMPPGGPRRSSDWLT